MHRWLLSLWLICMSSWAQTHQEEPILMLVHGVEFVGDVRQMEPRALSTQTNQLLLRSLGPYPIEFQTASMTRIERLLQTKPNACALNRVKTPQREKTSYFSKPINLYLGFQLYFIPNEIILPGKALNADGQLISLNALFRAEPDKVLGLGRDRSYGAEIDEQVTKLEDAQLFLHGGKVSFASMVSLLVKRRVDFLLEYPLDMNKELRSQDSRLRVASVEVADTPRYIVGHVECAKTETGKHFIEDVDVTLNKLYGSKAFMQAHTRYLDEADLPVFERYYRQVFKTD